MQTRSTARRVVVNAAANWLGFAAGVVATFFVTPLLVNGLGERAYGVWALVESVLAYLALFDLGIGAAVVRYGAKFGATKQTEEFNRVFSTSCALFAALGLLALGIALGMAFIPDNPLGVPPDLAYLTRWLIVLLGVNVATALPLGVYDALLCALERFPLRTGVQLVVLVLRTFAFLVILQHGGGLLEIGLAITFFGILQNLVLALAAHLVVPSLRFSHRFVNITTFHTIRGYSLWAFVIMIAGRLSFSTDAIVIGANLSPEHITYFAIGARLTEYCKSAIRPLTSVLTPIISAHDSVGDRDSIRRILLVGSQVTVWCAMPIQLGLIVLGYQFTELWISPEIAAASYAPLAILALPIALTASQSVSGRVFYGVGDLKWLAAATLVEAGANLFLSFVLVNSLGIVGVAIGTAIPNILLNVALMWRACLLAELSPGRYAREVFGRSLLAGGCAVATWFVVDGLLGAGPLHWWRFFVIGICGVAGYSVALFTLETRLRELLGGAILRAAEWIGQRKLAAPISVIDEVEV